MLKILWWSLSFAAIFLFTCQQAFALSEDELNAALVEYNEKSTNISRKATLADWAVATDSGNKEKEQQKVRHIENTFILLPINKRKILIKITQKFIKNILGINVFLVYFIHLKKKLTITNILNVLIDLLI